MIAFGQASYKGTIGGVVTDPSGAVIPNASVTITENSTNLSRSVKTDSGGNYLFPGLQPSTYTIKAEAQGFRAMERKDLVLQVDQETTLNFALKVGGVAARVEVTEAAPLLDTGSPSLGTDVGNDMVSQIPLPGRNFFGLVFLNAGVTETTGSGITDQNNYPSGTNFVSNGQRNATAEIRMDGAPISAPEQGEGATSNVSYEPSVEVVQEFKVQSNSFSAEFGNNGGTIVNMALKSGTNAFHGSAWWFGQRTWLDANDFFNNASGIPRAEHKRDQYGASLGGPIRKNKAFFFVDFERVIDTSPIQILATVPTPAERMGDFSSTQIVDPNSGNLVPDLIFNPLQVSNGTRASFPGNVIGSQWMDPVGRQVINLYPLPNQPGNLDGTNNFRTSVPAPSKSLQFDAKVDYQFNDRMHLSGRLSHAHSSSSTPLVFGDGEFNDGTNYLTTVNNASLEYDWNIRPTTLLTTRLAVDRVFGPGYTNYPNPVNYGFPSILNTANGIVRMPGLLMDSPWTSLYDQCCVDTHFAHTLWAYAATLTQMRGRHTLKFGGEQRPFFNNFQQPSYPTGYFHFAQSVSEQVIGAFNPVQGNPFADLLVGMGDYGGIAIYPAVANKSVETGLFVQDDWKVTSKLTLNLGLRYEWSTPYTERFNRIQFSDFGGDSGVLNPVPGVLLGLVPGINLSGLPLGPTLKGITIYAGPGDRHVPVDRNNFAPRIGFAYALTPNTVIRGGAGIYYGMSVATNFQYAGTAFRKDGAINFTLDNFQTRYATLENPFPAGLPAPEGTQYGPLAEWGYGNGNDLGNTAALNANIYQWSLGVQRMLPGQIVVGVDYSANRSTRLPFGGYSSTRNRDFIPSSISKQFNTVDLNTQLYNTVNNPFQPMFCSAFNPNTSTCTTPGTTFNLPDSIYNSPQIPLINLLRPFPQFNGDFEGLPELVANSWYNALQIRFQKRASHYISLEGNYTIAKAIDDSSTGANAFVGLLNNGNPQQLDNLRAEYSVSANDAPQRLAVAAVLELPVGRGLWIGRDMNRVLDGFLGGWNVSTILTEQSGQPMAIGMSQGYLADGNQRPNVTCNPSSGISFHQAASSGASLFNTACFAFPGYNQPGDAPRYFSTLRSNGIHNMDLAFYKTIKLRESMNLQLRVDFFNFTNTPRFAIPDTLYGDSTFGQVSSSMPYSTPRYGQFGLRFEF
jgi:hypothetical protein